MGVSPSPRTGSPARDTSPSTLPGPQGFVLHSVTKASLALPPQYYPWICHPLPPHCFGFSFAVQSSNASHSSFGVKAVGLPWVRRASSPYPVQLHHKKVTPDIGSRSATPARPPPLGHLAGSLFATYTASASCFLQTSISGTALALLALPFRPVTVGVLLPPPFSV